MRLTVVGCWLLAICLICDPVSAQPTLIGARSCIAHAGASAITPSHTMAAYRRALELGADFVEPDLQLTRDGILVCLHDLSLERTTNVWEIYPERTTEITQDGRPVNPSLCARPPAEATLLNHAPDRGRLPGR